MKNAEIKILSYFFGKWKVEIIIVDSIKFQKGKTYVWGFPYDEGMLLNQEWNSENLNHLSGYFFAIRETNNRIEIVNDIIGGYRAYYSVIGNTIVVSDDYEHILKRIKENSNVTIDSNQFDYWKKHRFTLNDGTIFEEIKKFSPASIYHIDEKGINHYSYFLDVRRISNNSKLINYNFEEIRNNLIEVYYKTKDNLHLLFYSGGADSTFLLCLCREIGIPVKCVLIKYLPEWSINLSDIERATNYLNQLGQEYIIIEVDLYQARDEFEKIAAKEMLFDRHLAVHFYRAYKVIAEMYGRDIVVINGQSSDSILSFGPSEFTKGNFLKRAILACSNGPIGCVGRKVSSISKQQFILPCGKKDSCIAIMDDTNYIFAIDKKCQYYSLLEKEYKKIVALNITKYESERMYSKIISFLQGSDNQIVIRAASYNGINKIVMPFTSPFFIYNVIRYKNNLYEIFKPKYFVRNILKNRYNFTEERKKIQITNKSDFNMEKFEKNLMDSYMEKLKNLLNE